MESVEFASLIDFKFSAVFSGQVVLRDELFQFAHILQQIDLLLSSLRNKDTDDFPSGSVEQVGSQNIKRFQSLWVEVIQNRHKLFHAFF